MPTIRLLEHEKLTIHPDEFGRSITSLQFEKLCQFNDKNDNKYFTVIRNGIKVANYVGVIQIGNLVIEILPKADKIELRKENKEESFQQWRNVLLKMLKISGNLKIDSVSESMLKKRFNSLLDLYFEIYLTEVSLLIRNGLVKKYRNDSANIKALKGRINFSKNIQVNLIHQERFYTTHQCYDYEHLINQILLKGLNILRLITNDESIISRINKLLFAFPEIQEISIDEASFDNVNLNRKTEVYSEALKIARMLILNYSPDISNGEDDMIALLFDMNALWEKYIYKRLKQGEDGTYTVNYQEEVEFWEKRVINPDLVIRKDGEIIIVDTKWKLVEPDKPSDDELKQMYSYNLNWAARKSILLYPGAGNKKDGIYGKFHKGYVNGHYCKVGFIDVLNERGELNMDVAGQVLKKI